MNAAAPDRSARIRAVDCSVCRYYAWSSPMQPEAIGTGWHHPSCPRVRARRRGAPAAAHPLLRALCAENCLDTFGLGESGVSRHSSVPHPLLETLGTLGDASSTSGAIQTISAATGLPTNLTQAQATAFAALPFGVQEAIKTAQVDAATAAPAITLATTIASGAAPSPLAIIGGLAAVATLATGNPLVGATIGAIASFSAAAATVLEALFDALGLYSHVPSYSYVGFLRVCPKPPTPGCESDYVPANPQDPYWIDVSSFDKLENFYRHGDDNHPALSGNFDSSMFNLLYYAFVQAMTPAEAARVTGQNPYTGYLNQNAWDTYFGTLMIANLQFWANAKAYVPPQQLLSGALQAWNAVHDASTTLPYKPPPPGTPVGSATLSLTSIVLGPEGDSVAAAANGGQVNDLAPVTVNLGPLIPSVVAAAAAAKDAANAPGGSTSTASSSSSHTGAVVAGVAAVGIGGAAVWAAATGRLATWLARLHLS